MPNKPVTNEPTLEELSAYLDDELEADVKDRVAEHLAGCADCRARVDGLRQTAMAVRALPMESPQRSFTIPAQREQSSRRWAPAAWLGGTAAALLVVAFGVSQLHLPVGGTTSALRDNGRGQGAFSSQPENVAAPAGAGQDRVAQAFKAAGANQVTVIDPRSNGRRLMVATDQVSYAATGRITVTGLLAGDGSANRDQVRLVLRRGGYGVQLGPPSDSPSAGGRGFYGTYEVAALALPDPRPGSYTLTVSWTDGSGATLIAELPVTITG